MVIGPFINGAAILAGGIAGAMLGHRLPERVRLALPMTFGITSMGMGIVLIAKSFLDLFTALIFASTLGLAVALIAVPQLVIQLALAFGAVFILPLTTPAMQADFSAVGGLMMLATGLRICGIKLFPVANMLPALVLAMPISAAWVMFF